MSARYAFIFGRTPQLSLLELQAVAPAFGLTVGTMLEHEIVEVSASEPLSSEDVDRLQNVLGGTIRIAELLRTTHHDGLLTEACALVEYYAADEGKLTLGINTWSDSGRPFAPQRLARDLKDRLAEAGRSVRVVTPQPPYNSLNAPQLIHNKLVGSAASEAGRALDLVCIWSGNQWHLGFTRTVQNIADYSRRDFGIPYPDPVSGMLPPKLAQIMVNLGVDGDGGLTVYDPFCGNGRIVLETMLLGLNVLGSDIRPEQVEATQKNASWMSREYGLPELHPDRVWQADATKGPGRALDEDFVIVTEPYLGRPLRSPLKPDQKAAWLIEVTPLFIDFFEYWASASERPQCMVVVFPRAKCTDGTEASVYSAVVDRLNQIGYSAEVLFCYDRPDSLVRRDLVCVRFARSKEHPA
jgi:tRNA G10  N-methylase Trm11